MKVYTKKYRIVYAETNAETEIVEASTPEDALDVYARRCGYKDFSDAIDFSKLYARDFKAVDASVE